MANPVFTSDNFKNQMKSDRTVAELNEMYAAPSATPQQMQQPARLTYADVINKTIMTLGLVIIGAFIGWTVANPMTGGAAIYFIAVAVGFVLGLVNSFKREPSPILILAYALAEGIFLGGLSAFLDSMYPGVATQAVLATIAVAAVVLALFKSGKVRASARGARIFMVALIGYAVFSLLNLVLMMFGVTQSMFGLQSGMLGLVIGLIAVGLASYSLVMDFTVIDQAVKQGAPEKFSWSAAFGLTVTLIWLYVEILRILSILQQD